MGFRSLPKFDMRNPALRRALVEGRESVVGRWLEVLDGWRIDVANQTGRHRDVDVAHDSRSRCGIGFARPGPSGMEGADGEDGPWSETVVVHVSRADYTPVRLPAGPFGSTLAGLAGTVDVAPSADGVVEMPGDSPPVRIWRTS